mgnify:CR=1 FL=1
MADVLYRPIRVVKDPLTANSRGAAMLALMSLGMMDTDGAANAVEIVDAAHFKIVDVVVGHATAIGLEALADRIYSVWRSRWKRG